MVKHKILICCLAACLALSSCNTKHKKKEMPVPSITITPTQAVFDYSDYLPSPTKYKSTEGVENTQEQLDRMYMDNIICEAGYNPIEQYKAYIAMKIVNTDMDNKKINYITENWYERNIDAYHSASSVTLNKNSTSSTEEYKIYDSNSKEFNIYSRYSDLDWYKQTVPIDENYTDLTLLKVYNMLSFIDDLSLIETDHTYDFYGTMSINFILNFVSMPGYAEVYDNDSIEFTLILNKLDYSIIGLTATLREPVVLIDSITSLEATIEEFSLSFTYDEPNIIVPDFALNTEYGSSDDIYDMLYPSGIVDDELDESDDELYDEADYGSDEGVTYFNDLDIEGLDLFLPGVTPKEDEEIGAQVVPTPTEIPIKDNTSTLDENDIQSENTDSSDENEE